MQIVTSPKVDRSTEPFQIGMTSDGYIGLVSQAICCANEDCQKATVTVNVQTFGRSPAGNYSPILGGKVLFAQRILPFSSAKPLPDFIPLPLREDYTEACLIRELSPKASATLIRRCLQGMIRDFCGISDKTLYKEISKLKALVEEGKAPSGVSIESVDAIDSVRAVGNIGAHMEEDINQIVTVEPDEAQILIDLTESLFDEWYVERHNRQARFGSVKALAQSKKAVQNNLRAIEKSDEPALIEKQIEP